jgi:hypothetical protein
VTSGRGGSWAPVAHTCNPNYSGVSLFKASPGKYLTNPISKKSITKKRYGGVGHGVGHEFKSQHRPPPKKKKEGDEGPGGSATHTAKCGTEG